MNIKEIILNLSIRDNSNPLIELLMAWRVWVVGAIVGGLVMSLVYGLFPPPFRAQATVLVDHNLDVAFPFYPDNRKGEYLNRESRKLVDLAWADQTLQAVVDQVGGTTVRELRDGKLLLSHPSDGGWHFWAMDSQPEEAEALAAAWVMAFSDRVEESRVISLQLEAARAELNAIMLANPNTQELEIEEQLNEISRLMGQASGVSAYVELSVSQIENLSVYPSVGSGSYILAGSFVGAVLLAGSVLLLGSDSSKDD